METAPVSLYAEEHGSGPPLLLLTGLGYAQWYWEPQLPVFAARRRVVTVDNRGSGRSPKPAGPYSIEALADDAVAVLDRVGVGTTAVLGHSMGGYIAQELALRHPARVDSLLLLGTSPGGAASLPVPESTAAVWLENAHLAPADFARATMHLSFAPGWTDEHPDLFEHYLAVRDEHPTPADAWRAQYDAARRWLEAGRPVEQIATPTLVVHGDADRVVRVENGREIARRVPGAELVVLPGRGHNLNLESPGELNRIVLGFLDAAQR